MPPASSSVPPATSTPLKRATVKVLALAPVLVPSVSTAIRQPAVKLATSLVPLVVPALPPTLELPVPVVALDLLAQLPAVVTVLALKASLVPANASAPTGTPLQTALSPAPVLPLETLAPATEAAMLLPVTVLVNLPMVLQIVRKNVHRRTAPSVLHVVFATQEARRMPVVPAILDTPALPAMPFALVVFPRLARTTGNVLPTPLAPAMPLNSSVSGPAAPTAPSVRLAGSAHSVTAHAPSTTVLSVPTTVSAQMPSSASAMLPHLKVTGPSPIVPTARPTTGAGTAPNSALAVPAMHAVATVFALMASAEQVCVPASLTL